MLNKIKLAVKNSFIFSFGNIASKIIGLILLPIITDKLNTSEYGGVGMAEVVTQVLIAIFGLSLYQALNRWYWDKDYKNKQQSMFFTVLCFVFFTSLFMIFSFSLFIEPMSIAIFDSSNYSFLLQIMLINAGLQIVTQIPATLMKLQQKSILFSVSNLLRFIFNLIFQIYFLIVLDLKIVGIYLGILFGNIIYLLFLSKYIIKNIKIKFELKILKEMFNFSYPLIFSSIGGVMLSTIDRFSLRALSEFGQIGLYSFGYKIANIIKVFIVKSAQLALTPMKYKMMDDKGNKRFYQKSATYLVFIVTFSAIGLSLFSMEAIKILATKHDYWEAYKIVPFISFSIIFIALRQSIGIGLNIAKKTKILASILIGMAIMNIVLNWALIPYFDSYGAAFATLLTQLIFFIVHYRISQKHYFVPYEINKITKMIILSGMIVGVSFISVEWELLYRLLFKTILLFSFPIGLYFLKFYDDVELYRIRGSWDKWRNPLNWKKNILK
ncbi:MAG: oligosaccharide flippase family protein [Candidatus Marinimicrobia bacterium]|nr:oligosaccharide flippase family protein [Candidatus Neomarinimicrobiota bacterium]